MWIVGADYYGKVDQIPGICHIRTRFIHVMCFPFVPTGSYLFLEGNQSGGGGPKPPSIQQVSSLLIAEAQAGDGARKIELSFKSIGFGWLRALLVVSIASCWGGALEALVEGRPPGWTFPLVAGSLGTAMVGAYLVTLPLGKPGSRRREYLLNLVARDQELTNIEADQMVIAVKSAERSSDA
jgi:hypothetical protein